MRLFLKLDKNKRANTHFRKILCHSQQNRNTTFALAFEVIHLLPAMEGIVLDHRSDPKTQETEKNFKSFKVNNIPLILISCSSP